MNATDLGPRRAPAVSVIVPTVDRPDALSITLDHLASQTLPSNEYEVVVVDDGSAEPLRLDTAAYPYALSVVRLERAGAAAARNRGAQATAGRLLVFVDDDISLASDALAAMRDASAETGEAVIVGSIAERRVNGEGAAREMAPPPRAASMRPTATQVAPMHFADCMTGFLAVSRSAFERLGGFQDPTGGWPSWDDVDFGYRAHRAGLAIRRALLAHAVHRDAAQATFEKTRDRWWRAAHSAAALFARYPELLGELPMFQDKVPIAWGRDPLDLIVRKALRRATATDVAMDVLVGCHRFLSTIGAPSRLSDAVAGLAVRGAMTRGYRSGLRALGG